MVSMALYLFINKFDHTSKEILNWLMKYKDVDPPAHHPRNSKEVLYFTKLHAKNELQTKWVTNTDSCILDVLHIFWALYHHYKNKMLHLRELCYDPCYCIPLPIEYTFNVNKKDLYKILDTMKHTSSQVQFHIKEDVPVHYHVCKPSLPKHKMNIYQKNILTWDNGYVAVSDKIYVSDRVSSMCYACVENINGTITNKDGIQIHLNIVDTRDDQYEEIVSLLRQTPTVRDRIAHHRALHRNGNVKGVANAIHFSKPRNYFQRCKILEELSYVLTKDEYEKYKDSDVLYDIDDLCFWEKKKYITNEELNILKKKYMLI